MLDLLGRRWALRVLWELRDGPVTFGALQQACDEVSTSVLATRLRELGAAGVVERDAQGYRLSASGRELGELLLQLNAWARRHAGDSQRRVDD
ncbi:MAG TPA: helix-turn-helix domain-containing protein [Kofleriaceae bacterium]|nr:helix-turn-helix domain-containing protein [Kofleriaceae bacterium]